ncbi:uncharacterized protein C8Q71DRAFT_72829 [Rhodofomes roseus]|uniref:Uncharacterized protein n=1 Tax=Rhodofomes roseus TaxID=34475 RepID=A0ABQ8KEV3_9APHY|nr:uncharacterized protein C8Q71DRAFT_72829 [Rhodofomes roseus]KAH9836245.1 hypothetical protein C8Q71DRAFT_72829 [Rhodofomes roseus]
MSDTPLPVSPITGNSSVLHSSNGPPLILVFLASGLLVGAVLSILVLRHIYPSRFGSRTDAVRVRKPPRPLGERPKLWDVYVCDGARGADVQWESLLPLAAAFLPDPLNEQVDVLPSPSLPAHRPHPWSWVEWLHRRLRHRPRESTADDLEQTLPLEGERPAPERLQIAVTIAMPSRSSPVRGSWTYLEKEKEGETSLSDLEEDRDLCIGLVEVPDVPRCFGTET